MEFENPYDPEDAPWCFIILTSVQTFIFILQFIGEMGELEGLNAFFTYFQSNSKKTRHGQIWRPLTHVFLHGNIMHLLFNMVMQVSLAWTLETEFGFWPKLILTYFICAVGGDLLSAFVKILQKSHSCGVGASGAIFGMEALWLINQICTFK